MYIYINIYTGTRRSQRAADYLILFEHRGFRDCTDAFKLFGLRITLD